MTKKIHTIQSSDKDKFDKEVNSFLELGYDLIDGSYELIKKDDGVVYSQVVVLDKNKFSVGFYDNGKKSYSISLKDGKEDGLWTRWYENGQKRSKGIYKDGKRCGLDTWWYENGQKKGEGTYKDGKKDGLWTNWYFNLQKECEENYKNGKYDGLSTQWYQNGQKWYERTYKDGELISEKQWNGNGSVMK